MSFLDMDEWLIELASRADLVYSPIADVKEFPPGVDICLVEGAVANEDNRHLARVLRERSRVVIAFGDCAVTGNVTALRNPLGVALEVLQLAYLRPHEEHARIPDDRTVVPVLLDRVMPLHAVVPVDYYLPGCPPPAERIRQLLSDLLDGRRPEQTADRISFG